MSVTGKGILGWKGARGYSAYEIAVQNGYIGTEVDWLAELGTASYFDRCSNIYVTTTANETQFNIPDCYTINSFIDLYVEGTRLDSDAYTIDTATNKIILDYPLEVIGTRLEVITLTMRSNNLPITDTLEATSTNETASGTKSVYDALLLKEDKTNKVTSITSSSTDTQYPSAKAVYDKATTDLNTKLTKTDIQVLTGSVSDIASGEVTIVDIDYPTGFTKATTVIIGKMVSSNNNYYDTADETMTTNGYPMIETVALTDSKIRVWLKNTNNSQTRNGHYKITVMKVGA